MRSKYLKRLLCLSFSTYQIWCLVLKGETLISKRQGQTEQDQVACDGQYGHHPTGQNQPVHYSQQVHYQSRPYNGLTPRSQVQAGLGIAGLIVLVGVVLIVCFWYRWYKYRQRKQLQQLETREQQFRKSNPYRRKGQQIQGHYSRADKTSQPNLHYQGFNQQLYQKFNQQDYQQFNKQAYQQLTQQIHQSNSIPYNPTCQNHSIKITQVNKNPYYN